MPLGLSRIEGKNPKDFFENEKGLGRPHKVSLGFHGKPRKVYAVTEYVDEAETIFVFLTEMQLRNALSSSGWFTVKEWMVAMTNEVKLILMKNTWDWVDRSDIVLYCVITM